MSLGGRGSAGGVLKVGFGGNAVCGVGAQSPACSIPTAPIASQCLPCLAAGAERRLRPRRTLTKDINGFPEGNVQANRFVIYFADLLVHYECTRINSIRRRHSFLKYDLFTASRPALQTGIPLVKNYSNIDLDISN